MYVYVGKRVVDFVVVWKCKLENFVMIFQNFGIFGHFEKPSRAIYFATSETGCKAKL